MLFSPKTKTIQSFKAKESTAKKLNSFREIASLFSLIGFFGWSALCAFLIISWFFNLHKSGIIDAAANGDEVSRVGGGLGIFFGIGMIFLIWLGGAVPTFMVWIITKKR